MRVHKRVGARLLALVAAAAVAIAALPAQPFTVFAGSGENLLAGLEWTTDIPDGQFIYGQGPGVNFAIKTWLTDGVYDDGQYDNGAKVVGFNTPGYLEFDMGEEQTFRQVRITSATTQSFQNPISVFSQMKIAVYTNGSWKVVCDAQDLPYQSNHTYVLGCSEDNSITGSRIRFYFKPGLGLNLNVFSELEVLEEAPDGPVDGVMKSTGSQTPDELTDFAKGRTYVTNWQDSEYNAGHEDFDRTKLTDDATATSIWSADAVHYHKRANGDPVTFTFDLDYQQKLHRVEIAGVNGGFGVWGPAHYQVEYFDEAANAWVTAGEDEPAQVEGPYTYTVDFPDAPVSAQQVRISVTPAPNPESTLVCLTDIRIFGTMPDVDVPVLTEDLPETATIYVGSPFTLSVEASINDSGTLSYQWLKDGEPVGENSPSYTIDNVTLADEGSYQVKVTNTKNGAVVDKFSKICAVKVIDPNAPAVAPTILTDLPGQKLAETGETVSFAVSASVSDGGVLSYQWYKDDEPIGENSPEFTIDSVLPSDSGDYRVVVTNTKGSTYEVAESTTCALSIVERMENIALGRPYTTDFASSEGAYYESNSDDNFKLTNGVILNTPDYRDPDWTGLVRVNSVAFGIDLGKIATINQVKAHVYTYDRDGITSAQGYTVQVSPDGFHWETVHNDQNVLGQEWLTYTAPGTGLKARFVKVTMKTGWFLFLDEIEILGTGGKELEPDPDPDTFANQAKGKAYYLYASDPALPAADKAAWPDTTGSLLTDGVVDSTGDWQQNQSQWVSWQKGSGDLDITAIFDLRAEKAIHEINASFVQDAANGVKLPENMEIWVSNEVNGENINWLKLYDEAVAASTGKTVKLTYTAPEVFRARYVKLVFKQTSDYMGLGEIEINGKGNTTGAADPIDLISQGLTNLSQGKEYTLSDENSQYPDTNYELTDGKFASGGAEDAAWTGFSFTPGGARFVTIDLGDTYMVNKFVANLLTSGVSSLPRDIQFFVSQDKENWTTVCSIRNPKPSGDTYKVQSFLGTPVKARYVMCYLYGDSGISLIDEIEVFGDETPVKPDVTPPTPSTEAKNYLIPGEATGGIKNLAILDTAKFQNAGSVLEQGFDGIAVIGDTSGYGKILSDLNQKANGTVKIVLGAKDAASIDSAVSAFESGSYGKLELVGILIESDLSGADALTAKIHGKSLKAFWIGDYNASGIAGWKDHGIDAAICQAGSSNLTAAAKTAKENGLGMALDASQGYDEYLNYLDAAVKDSFQGKYVFRAYILGAQSGTDEQNARMLESTEKLMKGTLKVSNRNTPAAPTAAETYSTWVSLKAVNGYEYSKDGSSWTIDPVFTGLTPETSYTFYQRIKENHNAEASLMSTGLNVTTPETPTEAEPTAPTITTNLNSSKQAKAGDKVTLTVAASVSDGGTLSYQWYKGDQAINGATSAAYTIDSIQKSDEGSYKVIVTNTLNGKTATATSNVCAITVEVPAEPTAPTITSNLNSSRTAKTGDRVTFAVTAVSNNNGTLSYQWYKNGKAITGATDASYTIASASLSDGGIYYVDVTDESNSAHTVSNSCTLTVTEKDLPSGGGSTGGWGGTPVKPDIVVGVWKQLSDGNWQYVEDNKPVTGWKSINSVQYYFNSEGIMQTGWFQDSGHWYYLQDNGAMATGWVKVGSTWYYFHDNGRMATGWLKLGNTWFYLNSNGAMQTGWLQEGSTWYYLHDWGGMANTEWVKAANTWYYFRGNGAMMTGWLQSGNTWYYLKSSGAMATGWNWVGNNCYYFNASGKMAANTTVGGYKVDASGAWVK